MRVPSPRFPATRNEKLLGGLLKLSRSIEWKPWEKQTKNRDRKNYVGDEDYRA